MKKKFLYEKTSPLSSNRNELSYIKSNKENNKLYFKTENNNDYYFNNECPGGKECKNYITILKLECKIKNLKKIIEDLKNTNQYLCFTMDQKEKIFKNLVNDIEHFPVIVKKNNNNTFRKKSNNKNSFININNNNDDNFNKEKKIFKISLNKKINSSSKKTSKKNFITFSNTKNKENNKNDEIFSKTINNNITKINNNNNNNKENYEKIENNEINIKKKRFNRINTISFNKTAFFSLKNPPLTSNFKDEKDESSKSIYFLSTNNNQKNNNNKKNPYDEILSLNQLTQKPILQSNNMGVSFLSLSNAALYELYTNQALNDLYKLTLNDDDFINEFKNSETNILTNYCDLIGLLIKDFKNAMILIQRIKLFLNSSLNLINSIELGDSSSTLIKITSKILNCERVSLFTYESITDMLIVHTAEGLKKNQIKVPKDKGIVGHVFMNKEKLKIDDAYQDIRFNKEIDKKTGFRTRNILCYPLIDNDNHCFGAIQAINKKKNFNDYDDYNNYNNININNNNFKVTFDSNDEELFCILSQQASIILKNNINKGEAELQINRLKLIIKFSVNLIQVKNLIDFNDLTERMLIDAFNASHVQVFFNVNGLLYNLSENKFHKKTNIGIAYYVFQKKIYHICDKINTCSYYNILIDSQTNSNLITYPIIDKTNNEVLIIIQVGSIINMQDDGKKLKENEEMVYETIQIILGEWLNKNKNLLKELNEKYKNVKESIFI